MTLATQQTRAKTLAVVVPLLAFVFLFQLSALALLPPSAYEAMQAAAPESLTIEVLKVDFEPLEENASERAVTATASVIAVERSASGLQPGDFIQITYRIPIKHPAAADRELIPILQAGQETPAFLAQCEDGLFYRPVAGSMSFARF